MAPQAPLIAETGGLNAMIVDSTALPEQVVRDVLASAFQSAGQRCSALRLLYLQEDVAERILKMLFGAMDELQIEDPWYLSSDIGPVIDAAAKRKIEAHCAAMKAQGRVLKTLAAPERGLFVAPCVIELDGIEQLEEEIFGPVLHVARFAAERIDAVVDAVNASGYGLTFGIHTRVDSRVEQIVKRLRVGNVYVNRNQIGAVVGTQPFGGEGLSGTGPKAGGPSYLPRFLKRAVSEMQSDTAAEAVDRAGLEAAIAEAAQRAAAVAAIDLALLAQIAREQGIEWHGRSRLGMQPMPGPTGESNQLSLHPRGLVLCLGPTAELVLEQALTALSQQNSAVLAAAGGAELGRVLQRHGLPAAGIDGSVEAALLQGVDGFDAVMSQAATDSLRAYRVALAAREGKLIPLLCEADDAERLIIERHVCIDTTAAGGNASLIASTG